jgi:DNA-binding GntR family transcriptional regulator
MQVRPPWMKTAPRKSATAAAGFRVAATRTSGGDGIGATTAMRVAGDLRRRILAGEFTPGARLKIDDLSALCEVSHMPVRAALQQLEAEGVLDVFPHRGAVIRGVDARFVRNIYDLRASIEAMLAERCARRIDKAGVAELRTLAGEFESAAQRGDVPAMVAANLHLHEAINQVADNPEAVRVLGQGRLLIQALRMRFGFAACRVEAIVAEHRALLRAIQRKDERKAGDIARWHCDGARDDLLALLAR